MSLVIGRTVILLIVLGLHHQYNAVFFVHASEEIADEGLKNGDSISDLPETTPAISDDITFDPVHNVGVGEVNEKDGVENNQLMLNDSVLNSQNETKVIKNGTDAKIRCVLKMVSEDEIPAVNLVNSSALVKALAPVPNVTSGECVVVMFYSPYCVFSAKAAPHFNAIPRFFPQISFYAIDAITFTSLNMRYGLVAVPTVLLFHNGKASVKYNDSEPTLEKMVSFLTKYTGIVPQGKVSILPEDSDGPISSTPLSRRDYVLILSWMFTLSFCCVWFAKSSVCRRMVECIRNTWQEAEAQHEHED